MTSLAPPLHPRLLIVTREQLADRRYGLGRSIVPVQHALEHRQWLTHYLCQQDLSAAQHQRRHTLHQQLCALPWIRHRPLRQQLLYAWLERLHIGRYAAKIAQKHHYHYVHLHDPWLAEGFRRALPRHHDIRWGITEHGFGCYSRATHEDGLTQGARAQRLFRRLEARTLAAADWVIAPTQLALEQLARDLALPQCPPHWHAVPHYAHLAELPARTTARLQLGWKEHEFYILGIGRLVSLKRFDRLVEAWLTLAARYPHLHLVLLGDGDHRTFQTLARHAGYEQRLHCTVTDDVTPFLAAADIYVSTSSSESFGLANVEALRAGLPSLCTAVGGVPEIVGDGANLLPPDAHTLTRQLARRLENPEILAADRLAAQHRAAELPTLESICDRYVEIYQTHSRSTP